MKKEYKILLVVLLGVVTLFFFPSPQQNFGFYILTILVFAGIIVWMMKKDKNSKKG